MNGSEPFTIEQFWKNVSQGRLMAGKCKKCGKTLFPPRPSCDSCLSRDFEWIEIPPTGKLKTYTVIHVAPQQFQAIAPYAVGIIEFEDGMKIPGMIKGVTLEKLKIGMPLTIEFEACVSSNQWPLWPRYNFTPL